MKKTMFNAAVLDYEQAKKILGGEGPGTGGNVCDNFRTCSTEDMQYCTFDQSCDDGASDLMNCEDEEKCWQCRAYLAH